MDPKAILDKLREWHEFTPRAMTELAESREEFERLMNQLVLKGVVLRIVVNDRVYYRRARP